MVYLDFLEHTETIFDVQARIEAFHRSVTKRGRKSIPV